MKQQVLSLVGGISKNSINQKLFNAMKPFLEKNFEVVQFQIETLPYFSQDLESDLPASVKDLKTQIEKSAGIIIYTPEYNRSIPGVLKNAIDWGTRPYGKSSWTGKKTTVIGLTPGNPGTLAAQQNARLVLSACGAYTMTHPEMYLTHDKVLNENDEFVSEKTKAYIQKYIDSFKSFIEDGLKASEQQ